MTLGKREYSESEMLRMQRDAEERVREMQARARNLGEQESPAAPPSRNRNWNSGVNTRRGGAYRSDSARQNQEQRRRRQEPEQQPRQEAVPPPREPEHIPAEPQKSTTVIEDVMSALNLDEDYLLIIGLLLILINQRADATLILALAYLLI